MQWIREGELEFPGSALGSDVVRALRPSVVEAADGTLRMWYALGDAERSRIVERSKGRTARGSHSGRRSTSAQGAAAISYAVESPCVMETPGGYVMVYDGFEGEVERLHMATSGDGHRWERQGTIMQRGDEDAGGANDPWLLVTGERWWLFYTGIRDPNGTRTSILAGVPDLLREVPGTMGGLTLRTDADAPTRTRARTSEIVHPG